MYDINKKSRKITDTYCVIMAGGIGSRFWPLSRISHPKQFLDILGTGKSLIRHTFERFIPVCPIENFYVVTNLEYVDIVLKQIPELIPSQILAEPLRRNTAPCIAFANIHIQKRNPNANVIVTPADHLIINEFDFITALNHSLNFVSKKDVLLTLGITPSRPETGYGYIQAAEEVTGFGGIFRKVKTFTEKPSSEIAKFFLESGEFYWNSGIFLWSIKSINNAFEKHLPDIHILFNKIAHAANTPEEEILIHKTYEECDSISIDYGIMERASNVYMQAVNFGWSDLGTWSSLHETSTKDIHENAVISGKTLLYETNGSIINVPSNKIAVIQGLENYIVVDSKDALLICAKKNEQFIKQFTNDIKTEHGSKSL